MIAIRMALMAALARLAKSRGGVYIEGLVDGGNRPAERFYAAVGAHLDDGKTVCRIDGAALDGLAKEEGSGPC